MEGQELIEIADRLKVVADGLEVDELTQGLRRIGTVCEQVGQAWSGSNLGYHSVVYYAGLARPPAGAHFSIESGIADAWPLDGSVGTWEEYRYDDVVAEIKRRSGNPDLKKIEAASLAVVQAVDEAKQTIASLLSEALRDSPDSFLEEVKSKIASECILSEQDGARAMLPRGQFISRDMRAMTQGMRLAPHQAVTLKMALLGAPGIVARKISGLARQAGSHLLRVEGRKRKSSLVGTNVFIGHGRSLLWRALKDFVQDRLHLPADEFNRVPVAGVTNIARLNLASTPGGSRTHFQKFLSTGPCPSMLIICSMSA